MEQEEVLRAAKLFAHSVHTNDRSGHD
ncbi:MAG: hypothetical protein K0R67_168, partial [Paenibacillus sp.]|nr:hypothetical protein [Paenibacillus sp.]